MELDLKIVKSALVWARFGALRKRSLVQNQIIDRVVYSNTFSMKWFSYFSNRNPNSFLISWPMTKNDVSKKWHFWKKMGKKIAERKSYTIF